MTKRHPSDKGAADLCFHVERSKDRDNVREECYFEFDGKTWNQFSDTSLKEKVWQIRNKHTVKETAEKYGVCGRTVRNWVREINALRRAEYNNWDQNRTGQAGGKVTG